jgi:hypothetical protein
MSSKDSCDLLGGYRDYEVQFYLKFDGGYDIGWIVLSKYDTLEKAQEERIRILKKNDVGIINDFFYTRMCKLSGKPQLIITTDTLRIVECTYTIKSNRSLPRINL